MKKLSLASLVLAATVVLFSGCNCFNRMQKNVALIEASSTPEVLALKGQNVSADLTVAFPPKYFNEEAIMRVTPVLVFDGGEIAGTPKYLQGEKVKDNYNVISWKHGGSYTQTVVFPYDPRAQLSTLELRFEIRCSDKCRKKYHEFMPVAAMSVAQGISTVQNLVFVANGDGQGVAYEMMPDNFRRVNTITEDASIHYLVNSANVRPAQLTQEQIKLFENFVKENSDRNGVKLGNLYSKGYASPEGPENFNEQLSKRRSESGQAAMKKQLKGVDVDYDASWYGEDWEGFKKLVEASDIKDKDLILQVLAMYDSPAVRDREIRNMSAVLRVLEERILPELRRTQFVMTADVEGMTDAQILAAARKNDKNLTVEEILYGAGMTNDLKEKAAIYQLAANQYNDVRAYNNLGVVYAQMGKYSEAENALNRAARIEAAPQVSNNMAALAISRGDYEQARKYLSALSGPAARNNKGLLAMAEGNYSAAARDLTGYNKAVAEVADGNYAAAKTALGGNSSADAEYLRAIIAMRQGDSKGAVAYLNSAVKKNPALKQKAARDVEFAKLFGTQEFLAL